MSHNRETQFYEMRAKLTLERIPALKYESLILSDMPDLLTSDGSIGIEVTRAISRHDAEQLSTFEKLFENKHLDSIPQKSVDRFCKDGTKLVTTGDFGVAPPDVICGFSPEAVWFSTETVENAITQKIKHINRVQYQATDMLALYVFTDSFRDYENKYVLEILNHVYPWQDTCRKAFDTIYIDDCGWFYECDMRRKRIRFFDTQGILRGINEDTKAFVDRI